MPRGDVLIDKARRAKRELELYCTVMFQISRLGTKISVDVASIVDTAKNQLRF